MAGKARVLIFTGEGKGKTTAALGMVLRASGHGLRSIIIQFIKNDPTTGEIQAIRHLPGTEIEQVGLGFVPAPDSPEFPAHCLAAQKGLDLAARAIESAEHSLIVLDEVCTAVSYGLLEERAVSEAVERAGPGCCVVLTGRGATEALIALADTVTEMRCVKHGLDAGHRAQKGVEF